MSFHIAAQHSLLRKLLSCAKLVLRWWQTKPRGEHPCGQTAVAAHLREQVDVLLLVLLCMGVLLPACAQALACFGPAYICAYLSSDTQLHSL